VYVNEKMRPVETIPGIRGMSIKENDGGENLTMKYSIYCKNFCKCHHVPPPSTTKKKKQWKQTQKLIKVYIKKMLRVKKKTETWVKARLCNGYLSRFLEFLYHKAILPIHNKITEIKTFHMIIFCELYNFKCF
jgi:hypothetical protein